MLLFNACYINPMKIRLLKDNSTRVPLESMVYKNKVKFNDSLLRWIDTNALYISYSERDNWSSVLKFYPNGFVNYFPFSGHEIPNGDFFHPDNKGYRGVYYIEDTIIRLDLFAAIDPQRHIGLLTSKLFVSHDTIIEFREVEPRYPTNYIKRELPLDYFQYKVNW